MNKAVRLVFFSLCIFFGKLNAQIDQEFWFAPPDLIRGTQSEINGGAFRDRPILLVVSSINEPAQVKIWQPANLSFAPIVVNLAAASTRSINLTQWISQIETSVPDSVMNTGILIRSTAPITAYYELGAAANRDLISLKGKNANGKLFFTPFQTLWENARTLGGMPYQPQPRSGFVIVATDDTTQVTITPNINILNHPAGIPFTVMLHRGQTYYCEATGSTPVERPVGTRIESDKPIAVTVKDDMIDVDMSNEGGADLSADQLIAVEKCGMKHIVVKGRLMNNLDRVFVLGIEDSTDIYIDGQVDPVATIMAGEQYVYEFSADAGFIRGSKKISLLHVSGTDEQVAGAVIPSLECTGSNQIGFTRPGSGDFRLTLTIKNGSQNSFLLNGNPLDGSGFQPVPGSNDEWVYLNRIFTTAEVPTGQASLITNFSDELFHMGTSYRHGASCNYGYFSNFSYLNLGVNRELCLGDSAILDAGPGKTRYRWSTGDTTQKIVVKSPGVFIVDVLSGNECAASDTIEVSYYKPPVKIMQSRDTICEGSQLLLTVPGTYLFEWHDGTTTTPFYMASDSGLYWVEVTDYQGCRARDSARVYTAPRPTTPEALIVPFGPEITSDTLCAGESLTLNMNPVDGADSYGWMKYSAQGPNLYQGQQIELSNLSPSNSGEYLAFVTINGCESFFDTLSILVNPTPEVYIGLTDTVCDSQSILLDAGAGSGYQYEWQDGSVNQTFLAESNGHYWVAVTNPSGCTKRDSVDLYFSVSPPSPQISIFNEVLDSAAFCAGQPLQLSMSSLDQAIYFWVTPSGSTLNTGLNLNIPSTSLQNGGKYYAFYSKNGCKSLYDSVSIHIADSPIFSLGSADTTLCGNDTLFLQAPAMPGLSYLWSDQSTDSISNAITSSGKWWLKLTNATGCSYTDTMNVDFSFIPHLQLNEQTVVCIGQSLDLSVVAEEGVKYYWSGPGFSSNETAISVENPQSGATYSVWAENKGCFSKDTIDVTVILQPVPVLDLGPDVTICKGTSIQLSGPEGMRRYLWSNGDTSSTASFAPGVVSLTVRNNEGCSTSDTILIQASGPEAHFTSNPAEGALTNMNIAFSDQSTGGPVAWTWDFGNGQQSDMSNPNYAFPAVGTFTVKLVVRDENGCTDTTQAVYEISNRIAIPNSFTPNGDGKNELFVIKGLDGFPDSELKIFNRWGNEVYASNDYQNNWDGGGVSDGVYFYVLKLKNGESMKGSLTLRRQ